VGPSIADDIKTGAIYSVVLALIAIGLYILIRFRNIAYSIGSIVALSCDTIMIIGAYSLLWGIVPFSLEIDQTFIGAILTAIGYSINDKVVIFDRVREFFGLYPKRDKFQLFNDSLNTTLARTVNTSICTLLVMLCIFILGAESFTTIGFQTSGSSAKFKIITKMPGEQTADRNDPYGEKGFASIKWYYGFVPLRPERLAVYKSVAPL
jgi:SecD/SecF fusion protein